MKALLWKESLLLKKKIQKMLLLIAIEFVLVLYFIYGLNSVPIHIKFNLILGTTSIIFLYKYFLNPLRQINKIEYMKKCCKSFLYRRY